MDQARIDFFLDDGWSVIGQLHRWLSKWPLAAHDRAELIDLIQGLQGLWSVADDLGLSRLARTSLAVEQMLERFCARTLAFNAERLRDFTVGVGCLQELLLGLEATREEPPFADLGAVLRMERHTRRIDPLDIEQVILAIGESQVVTTQGTAEVPVSEQSGETTSVLPSVSSGTSIITESNSGVEFEVMRSQIDELTNVRSVIEWAVVAMLERFVVKIDDTCQRLHSRMVADESPYVTTTSRLQHLAQAARELVDQLVIQTSGPDSTTAASQLPPLEHVMILEEPSPLLAMEQTSISALDEDFETSNEGGDSDADQLKRRMSITRSLPSQRAPESAGSNQKSRRILIVEESMFYRHLIGIAVQSAGYEPYTAESIEEGLAILTQSADFCAVLATPKVSAAMAKIIENCRQMYGVKVILLTTSSDEESDVSDADGKVTRSHPQQLVMMVERLLNGSSGETRKSA